MKLENQYVYLLSGVNVTAKEQYIKDLKDKILENNITDFNYDVFYADTTQAKDVLNVCLTLPFIGGKRLVIVRRVEAYSVKDKKELIEYCESPSEFTYLILCVNQKPPKDAWYKNIAKLAVEKAFWPYKEYEILNIIHKRLSDKNKKLDKDAADLLLDMIGENPIDLDTEIGKLIDFDTNSGIITKDDVMSLITKGKQDNIFKWVSLITDGKYKSALKLFLEFINSDTVKYPYLLYLLSDRYIKIFRFNALLKDGLDIKTAMRNLGINAYFDKDFGRTASKYNNTKLSKIFDYLINADLELKTGKKTQNIIIEQLIINIAQIK